MVAFLLSAGVTFIQNAEYMVDGVRFRRTKPAAPRALSSGDNRSSRLIFLQSFEVHRAISAKLTSQTHYFYKVILR